MSFTVNLYSFGIYATQGEDIDDVVKDKDYELYDIHELKCHEMKLSTNKTGLDVGFRRKIFKLDIYDDKYREMKEEIIDKIIEKINKDIYYINIAICCSYGMHRSVSFIERLYNDLQKQKSDYKIIINKAHLSL